MRNPCPEGVTLLPFDALSAAHALKYARTAADLLAHLLKANLITGYELEVDGTCCVTIRFRGADGGRDLSMGGGTTLEGALSKALRNAPGDVNAACAPALLRWSIKAVAP